MAKGDESRRGGVSRDFLHFLSVASGSTKEVETQILIAERLNYIDNRKMSELLKLTAEVGRLNSGLRHSLRRKDN